MFHQIVASNLELTEFMHILSNSLSNLLHMINIFSSSVYRWIMDNFRNWKMHIEYFFFTVKHLDWKKITGFLYQIGWDRRNCIQIQHAIQVESLKPKETSPCQLNQSKSCTKKPKEIHSTTELARTAEQPPRWVSTPARRRAGARGHECWWVSRRGDSPLTAAAPCRTPRW
jgi:hypothetical protein